MVLYCNILFITANCNLQIVHKVLIMVIWPQVYHFNFFATQQQSYCLSLVSIFRIVWIFIS